LPGALQGFVLGRALDAAALAATYDEYERCVSGSEAVSEAFVAAGRASIRQFQAATVTDEGLLGLLALLHNPVITERVTPEAQVLRCPLQPASTIN
jgi:hypothetical protein